MMIFSAFLPGVYAEDQNIGVTQKDGFELTLTTDKKEYHEGEPVEISFVLKNIMNQNNTYSDTPCGLRISIDGYNIFDLVLIRRNSEGNFTGEKYVLKQAYCVQVVSEFTLSPNESREFKLLWTQEVSRKGEPYRRIDSGTYNISFTAFWGLTSTVSVKINEHLSPRQQVVNGILPNDVICKGGLKLIFKSKDNSPGCVKQETIEKLVERGWGTILPVEAPWIKMSEPVTEKENELFQPRSDDKEIFEFLSGNSWKNSGCRPFTGHFPPTCTRLEFRRDGEFKSIVSSDYSAISLNKWNFMAINSTSGLIYLDGISPVRYEKVGNELIYGAEKYTPSDKIEYSIGESKFDRENLPKTTLPGTYYKLIKNSWKKTNDFDLGISPDLLIFKNDSKLVVSYGNIHCTEEGIWSSTENSVSISYPFDCSVFGPSPGNASEEGYFELEDDLLVFYGVSYYNTSLSLGKNVIIFDNYVNTIKVKGEFYGDFKRNSQIMIYLSFQNVSDLDKELGDFAIKLFTCGPPELNTGCSNAKQNFIITKNYTGILLHSTELYYDKVTITPTTSGDNYLEFSLNFKDKYQPYQGNIGYVVHID